MTPPVVKLALAQSITLQFNISTDDSHAMYIAGYNWFHNGSCIDCVWNERYQFDLNNTRLTILNTTNEDAGVYEARVTSFDFKRNEMDEQCIGKLAYLTSNHATYAPVIYYLNRSWFHI